MSQKIIKARMFDKSEYRFNYFCLKDFNYGSVPIESIVIKDDIKCFEFNTMCTIIYNILNKHNVYKLLDKEKIILSYFEYNNGTYKFLTSEMEDITDKISNSILAELKIPTHNKVYRYRYIISDDLVVVRAGSLGFNQNTQMDVVKDEMYTKENFLNKYGSLPEKSFSFSEIYV